MKLVKSDEAIVPSWFLLSTVLSCVYAKLPPKVSECLPSVQMALAEGLKRFWKTPVSAPKELAPAPEVHVEVIGRYSGPCDDITKGALDLDSFAQRATLL